MYVELSVEILEEENREILVSNLVTQDVDMRTLVFPLSARQCFISACFKAVFMISPLERIHPVCLQLF